jgi:hypothetical protein
MTAVCRCCRFEFIWHREIVGSADLGLGSYGSLGVSAYEFSAFGFSAFRFSAFGAFRFFFFFFLSS